MKIIILILSFFIIIGCENSENKIVTNKNEKKEKPELIPEAESLKLISNYINKIDKIKEWTAIDKRKIENENGNCSAEYYFLGNKLKKIKMTLIGQTSRTETNFFLSEDVLIYVFDKQIDSLELKSDPQNYEPYEDSFFFEKGNLIRILNNMDCGAPSSKEFLDSEQKRINNMFELLRNRLNKRNAFDVKKHRRKPRA